MNNDLSQNLSFARDSFLLFWRGVGSRYSSSTCALVSLLCEIEVKYGNLSQLLDSPNTPAAETIVSSDGELHVEHLERLFTHDATAIHIPNYYHKRTATKLGMELLHESQQENNNGEGRRNWKVSTSRGLESSDVITLGKHTPYNVAVAAALTRRSGSTNEDEINDNKKSKDGTDDYFEGVQKEFRSRRIRKQQQTTNDHVNDDGDDNEDYYRLWPLDKLRLELEEIWPGGAGLAREDDWAKKLTTEGQQQ
jgi:hypothetical protein